MGKKCVVRLCSFSQDMTSLPDGLTFHKFPSDVSQRQAWINALALPINWTPKARETICSRHFLKESFYPRKSESSKVFLKPFAIPTKFLGDSCAVMDLPTVPDSFVVPAFSVKPVPYTMDQKVELIMDSSNAVSVESNCADANDVNNLKRQHDGELELLASENKRLRQEIESLKKKVANGYKRETRAKKKQERTS